jgi:hypothetical protein
VGLLLQVEARDRAATTQRKGGRRLKQHKPKPSTAQQGAGAAAVSLQRSRSTSPSKVQQQQQQQHLPDGAAAAADGMAEQQAASPRQQQQQQQVPAQATRSSTAAAGGSTPISLSDPAAAFVLVATQEFLRLYAVGHVVGGDRTTLRKVALQGSLLFASAFVAGGAPALVCLLELDGEVHLQVFTLPGLQLVRGMPLSSLLGWPWRWDNRHAGAPPAASSSGALAGAAACASRAAAVAAPAAAAAGTAASLGRAMSGGSAHSAASCGLQAPSPGRIGCAAVAATRHGHLVLLGQGAELVRLSLAADAEAAPQLPLAVYSWDAAAAAHARGAALEQQQLRAWAAAAAAAAASAARRGREGSPAPAAAGAEAADGSIDSAHEQQHEQPTAAAAAAAAAGLQANGGKPNLRGFMTKINADFQKAGGEVARGFQRAFDETSKGLQKVAQVRRVRMPACLRHVPARSRLRPVSARRAD